MKYLFPTIHYSILVASTGIEPVSGASETLILSIVLRGLIIFNFQFFISQKLQYYFQIF